MLRKNTTRVAVVLCLNAPPENRNYYNHVFSSAMTCGDRCRLFQAFLKLSNPPIVLFLSICCPLSPRQENYSTVHPKHDSRAKNRPREDEGVCFIMTIISIFRIQHVTYVRENTNILNEEITGPSWSPESHAGFILFFFVNKILNNESCRPSPAFQR